MSTISDALKKVQKQRAAGTPPPEIGGRGVPPRVPAERLNPPPVREPVPEPDRVKPAIVAMVMILAAVWLVIWLRHTPAQPGVMPESSPVAAASAAPAEIPARLPASDLPPVTAKADTPGPAKADPVVSVPVPVSASTGVAAVTLPAVSKVEPSVPAEPVPPVVAPPPVAVAPAPVASAPPVVLSRLPPPADLPVLNGTLYAPRNPVAIVNGFAVKEGERVGAYEIVKILENSVVVRANGQNHELRLK